jgi:hypothetical protein
VASPDPDTDRNDHRLASGVSLQTLIIASLASAAAAYAASRIWGTGTLISAAATPVVVALVSEFLRRPVQTVATSAKRIPTVQTLPAVGRRASATPEDPTHARQDPRVEAPADVTPVAAPPTIHRAEPNTWRPRWRPAVVTGLLAFAIVVAVYTVPDLLAGHSVTGNGQPTTFFGASTNVKKKATPTTVTTTTSTTTVTKTTQATSTTTATPTTKTTTPTPTSTQTTSTTPPAVSPTTTPTSPAH